VAIGVGSRERVGRARRPGSPPERSLELADTVWHNAPVRFLRMKPGHGEVLITEGDLEVTEDEQRLIAEFRRQLDMGLWAAVPVTGSAGKRQAQMVRSFDDVPRDADRVIFFPRAAGGR